MPDTTVNTSSDKARYGSLKRYCIRKGGLQYLWLAGMLFFGVWLPRVCYTGGIRWLYSTTVSQVCCAGLICRPEALPDIGVPAKDARDEPSGRWSDFQCRRLGLLPFTPMARNALAFCRRLVCYWTPRTPCDLRRSHFLETNQHCNPGAADPLHRVKVSKPAKFAANPDTKASRFRSFSPQYVSWTVNLVT